MGRPEVGRLQSINGKKARLPKHLTWRMAASQTEGISKTDKVVVGQVNACIQARVPRTVAPSRNENDLRSCYTSSMGQPPDQAHPVFQMPTYDSEGFDTTMVDQMARKPQSEYLICAFLAGFMMSWHGESSLLMNGASAKYPKHM